MKPQEGTMRFKLRTFIQCVCLISGFFGVLSLSFYEISKPGAGAADADGRGDLQNKRDVPPPVWLERAPRSVNSDYDIYLPDINPIVAESILKDSDDYKPNLAKSEKFNSYQNSVDFDPKPSRNSINSINFNPKILLNKAVVSSPRNSLSLDDIFISVKTTKNFHESRLDIIIKTWFNLAKKQTWFFSDTDDADYQQKTGGHLVNTGCSSSHNRKALCCKMAREFDAFLEANTKWWCHFDDDNYVNVPTLVKTLESYDPQEDWYLGRPSIRAPLEIMNRDNISQKISFWFATGGAGFCISRSLGLKMMPIAGGGKFVSVGDKIRLPDDVTMGYIIEHLLKKKLTIVNEFHSHLEPMRVIDTSTLKEQISFGYSHYGSEMNVLPIQGLPETEDPTRFYTLHCILFPWATSCQNT